MEKIWAETGYQPRPHQKIIHLSRKRFSVLACHRRFGKTVAAVNQLLDAALVFEGQDGRFAYMAPTYKQAKAVAWDYLKKFAGRVPGAKFKETELSCELPNGSRIRLLGADRPDSLRGIYLDGAILDEAAHMPQRLWGEVVRPALADRRGWALFIGTPRGHDFFYRLFCRAKKDPAWYAAVFRASETRVIEEGELEAARREMTPEQFDQEFECSFSAAITGSYYGALLTEAEKQGRVTSVPADPVLPVHTAWDLGMADSTAIWFFQVGPAGETRVVDFYENSGQGLSHYVQALRERPYFYGAHIAPHDIMVRELGTGKSRFETARSLGVGFAVAPNLPVADGINAVRWLLPKVWFDEIKTEKGVEALRLYRRRTHEKSGEPGQGPAHDWTSHAADAFRYLAVGLDLAGGRSMTAHQAARLYEQHGPPRSRP